MQAGSHAWRQAQLLWVMHVLTVACVGGHCDMPLESWQGADNKEEGMHHAVALLQYKKEMAIASVFCDVVSTMGTKRC